MWRAISALLIVTVLCLLPVAAGASPPDPTWIAGIYDEADGDDVVWILDDTVACAHHDTDAFLVRFCLPAALIPSAPPAYETPCRLQRDRGPPHRIATHARPSIRTTPSCTSPLAVSVTANTTPRAPPA